MNRTEMNRTEMNRGEGQPDVPHARRPHQRRGRRIAIVLAAAAVVMAAAVATAGGPTGDDSQQLAPELQGAVELVFSQGRCVTASDAVDGIRARIDALGYDDWAIESGEGVQTNGCVSAGFNTSQKTILLIPAGGPQVAEAMQRVAEELRSRCLGKAQATELVSSVLTGLGVTDWSIRTDGPLAYPIGQREAVQSHIDSGCFVYSGSGHGPGGQSTYYISGPAR